MNSSPFAYDPWPALPYADFQSTAYYLHRIVQVIGKFKLHTPFEPHWSNVALWLTCRGMTTGLIPYKAGAFSIDLDMIDHHISCVTTWGLSKQINISSMSVAQFTAALLSMLHDMQINIEINMVPQEIPNPIPFNEDMTEREYNKALANAWWRILISSYRVMQRYHARFDGETPPVGFMWGTFDLRDARYNGVHVSVSGINADYIRRNAMNEAQVEIGWWPGNEFYTQSAYYSFTYPQPANIESAKIEPAYARWDDALKEFILDYNELRSSATPEEDLLAFFESTYQAGSTCANWNPELNTSGEPI